jgi:hypothetical protein
MIIKLIPETDEEKSRFRETFSSDEIVHDGVKEFFMFGNKIANNEQLLDFHEWTGSPRYLMGNLRYFFEVVNDERRLRETSNGRNAQSYKTNKIQFPKNEIIKEEVEGIEEENIARIMDNRLPKIIKKGYIDPDIQTIDVDNLKKTSGIESKEPKVIKISELKGKVVSVLDEDPIPSVPRIDFPNHFKR